MKNASGKKMFKGWVLRENWFNGFVDCIGGSFVVGLMLLALFNFVGYIIGITCSEGTGFIIVPHLDRLIIIFIGIPVFLGFLLGVSYSLKKGRFEEVE